MNRPKLGHNNLFGVVMDVNEGLYKIGTKAGVLPQRFTRNQFEPADNDFLQIENVPDKETTMRAAVGEESLTGVQGFIFLKSYQMFNLIGHKHCMCTSGCKTKKCSCKAQGRQCNSRCHNSNTCQNK